MILKIWKSYRLTNVVIAFMTILGLFVFIQNQYSKYNYYFLVENAAALGYMLVLVGGLLFMGNITNDYWDQKTDEWNGKTNNVFLNFNPTLNFTIAIIFWIIGLVGAILLAYQYSYVFLLYYLLASGLLLLYNYKLKKVAIVGNLVVALLTSSIVLLPISFFIVKNALILGYYLQNDVLFSDTVVLFLVNFILLILSFSFNFIREVVKDVMDYEGDKKSGYKTLPILLDEVKMKVLILIFHIINMLLCVVFLQWTYLLIPIFVVVCVIFMLQFFGYQFIYKKEYKKLSIIYKLSMGLGVLMLFF